MSLEHVALTITDPEEVENFYLNILGMNESRNFVLDRDLAVKIFGMDQAPSVFQLHNEDVFLEIFISESTGDHGFRHICLKVEDREELVNKAGQGGYSCTRISREYADLIFIRDKSGNIFEIKESQ